MRDDQYEQLPGGFLIPKRGHIAVRPYFASYLGSTIAALNAAIANGNTALTDMTAQRDTWQGRANTAYDSGVWGSGTAWSTRDANDVALYNATIPAGAGATPVSAVASHGGTSANGTIVQATTSRTGYWMAWWVGSPAISGGSGLMSFNMLANGVGVVPGITFGGPSGSSGQVGIGWDGGVLTTGSVIRIDMSGATAFASMGAGALHIIFVPTPSYPH